MTAATNTASTHGNLSIFFDAWSRSEELLSVLKRLPPKLVLKTGQSGRLHSIIDRWQILEAPGLDAVVEDDSINSIISWNSDAENIISVIIDVAREATRNGSRLQELQSIEESTFISEQWCWPWDKPRPTKDAIKWNKERLIKTAAVAGLGLMAIVTYLDEDD